MIWFGALIGVLVGIAFESLLLTCVFGTVGAVYSNMICRQQQRTNELVAALQKSLRQLEEQYNQLKSLETAHQEIHHAADEPVVQTTAHKEDIQVNVKPSHADIPGQPNQDTTSEPVTPAPITQQQKVDTAKQLDQTNQTIARPLRLKPAPAQPSLLELKLKQWLFGGNPIVKVGVVILFLGLAFLLRYASTYMVVPVELRYCGVAAAGIALLVAGWRLRRKKDNYGLILQGAGIAVMYLTPFAAMQISDLLPPELGFAVLVGVAFCAAVLAVLQNSLALAVVSVLGGFAAPVLAPGSGSHIGLFLFLSVLNLGIATVAWFRAWRILNLIGFVCTFVLVLMWGYRSYQPSLFSTTEPFLLFYFGLYVCITFLFARRVLTDSAYDEESTFEKQMAHSASHLNYVDGALVFGVPFVAFTIQYMLVHPFVNGAAFSALGFGLFYAALAWLLFHRTGRRYLLLTETLMALGVIFGSLAIPFALDQTWTSAAWAVEAAGVYWVGVRQQRIHARWFALLVFFISAINLMTTFDLDFYGQFHDSLLSGSFPGCLFVTASAAWICLLMRRAPTGLLHAHEITVRSWVMAAGAIFLACAPLTVLSTQWACAALAILGVVVLYGAIRYAENFMQQLSWMFHILAGLLFVTTLHTTAGGSALEVGMQSDAGMTGITGLFLVSLIGTGMLLSSWLFIRNWMQADNKFNSANKQITLVITIAILCGISFINLAPLFVLSLDSAALIWTVTGLVTLWWATRMQHIPAILLALLIELTASLVILPNISSFNQGDGLTITKPFMHGGFWGAILISVASFLCAKMLQSTSNRSAKFPSVMSKSAISNVEMGWIALFWSVAWWALAWGTEILRVAATELATASLLAVSMFTIITWITITRYWKWPEPGKLTLLYVPTLVFIAAHGWLSGVTHPLASWGALAWPVALILHFWLLRWQSKSSLNSLSQVIQIAHVGGAWLWVWLAASELRWWFSNLGETGSAWPILGWMIAPVIYLMLLSFKRVQQSWPVREQHNAYLLISAIPVAIYLTLWVWTSNIFSSGNAAPLPYIPLFNPLELAQFAVVVSIFRWWWPQRDVPALHGSERVFIGTGAATGLAMLTGIVARTCHHWGDVAWNSSALWDSTLFQTALSVSWSIVAIGAMIIANRNQHRKTWLTGAVLIGSVVIKLFLVELAAHGSLARIVSFIVVGLLLLMVGYYAPLPPALPQQQKKGQNDELPSS